MDAIVQTGTVPTKHYEPVVRSKLLGVTPEDEYGRMRDWLNERVARSKIAPFGEFVMLTPALALVLLNRNPDNRRIRVQDVEDMVRDIKNGAWKFNGETIIVADDGATNDGQHRCTAVVESGIAIPTMMVFGVDRESRMTVDSGTGKRIGDYVSMHGSPHGDLLSTIASFFLHYENTGSINNRKGRNAVYRPTKSEVFQFAVETPDLIRAIASIPPGKIKHLGSKALVAFCIYVFAKRSTWVDAETFFDLMINGADLPKGSPILYTRTRLAVDYGALKQHVRAELIFKAWNAWRKGESVTHFKVDGKSLPKLEA